MEERKTKEKEAGTKNLAGAKCKDRDCPFHGKLKDRGKTFEGTVIKKFPKRVTIEFERMIYIKKYERYERRKTRVYARLPQCLEN